MSSTVFSLETFGRLTSFILLRKISLISWDSWTPLNTIPESVTIYLPLKLLVMLRVSPPLIICNTHRAFSHCHMLDCSVTLSAHDDYWCEYVCVALWYSVALTHDKRSLKLQCYHVCKEHWLPVRTCAAPGGWIDLDGGVTSVSNWYGLRVIIEPFDVGRADTSRPPLDLDLSICWTTFKRRSLLIETEVFTSSEYDICFHSEPRLHPHVSAQNEGNI